MYSITWTPQGLLLHNQITETGSYVLRQQVWGKLINSNWHLAAESERMRLRGRMDLKQILNKRDVW